MRLKITSRIVSVMLEAHHFFTIFIFISLWWDKSTYPNKAQTCSFHGMTDFRNKVLLQYLIRGFLTKSDEIQNQIQNLMDMRVYHSDLKDLDNSSNCFYSFSWWNIFLLTSHFFLGIARPLGQHSKMTMNVHCKKGHSSFHLSLLFFSFIFTIVSLRPTANSLLTSRWVSWEKGPIKNTQTFATVGLYLPSFVVKYVIMPMWWR